MKKLTFILPLCANGFGTGKASNHVKTTDPTLVKKHQRQKYRSIRPVYFPASLYVFVG